MQIKAAVLREYNQPLSIEEITIDSPRANEVLLRTVGAGVCHSDLHNVQGLSGMPTDAVLGHEPAGIVEAVGSEVHSVKVGDHVVACTSLWCGFCPQCRSGHLHLCSQRQACGRAPGDTPRLSKDGEPLEQAAGLACFAEMMLVHERSVVAIDPDIPLDRAALLGCAVTTGTGAALNTAGVTPGSSVVVFGVGGVGVSIIQGARIAGARMIIGIDVLDEKLETAQHFGATHTLNGSHPNIVKEIKRLTNGGADFAFDAVGRKEIAENCLYCLAPRGLATLVGAVYPVTTKLELTVGHFFVEKRIQGCYMGSNRFQRDAPRYLDLYKQGRLNLDDMISRRISLAEINDAFRAMEAGEVTRTVIAFD